MPPRSSRTAETARDDAAAAAGLPSAGTWTTASTSELTVDYRLEVDNRVAGAVVVERDSISSQGSASEWKASLIQRCLP